MYDIRVSELMKIEDQLEAIGGIKKDRENEYSNLVHLMDLKKDNPVTRRKRRKETLKANDR